MIEVGKPKVKLGQVLKCVFTIEVPVKFPSCEGVIVIFGTQDEYGVVVEDWEWRPKNKS